MIIDKNVENLTREMNTLRVGLLQLVCSEELYEQDAKDDDRRDKTINGKEIISHDK